MADDDKADRDLTAGVPLAAFDKTPLVAGKVGDKDVLIVKGATGFYALDGLCTHAGAPLVDGMLVGDTLRCPWHHACFDVPTGAATVAPGLKALACWRVEQHGDRVVVGAAPASSAQRAGSAHRDERIVIVGAGGAGTAAAAALVDLGFGASVTLIGAEPDAPYDRTMLSKELLSGTCGEGDLPLQTEDLAGHGVDLRLGTSVAAVDPAYKRVRLADGGALAFTKLILAMGAEPNRLAVPGAQLPHVHLLRSAADARAIIAALDRARRVVVIGGSFIGLEAAAALRDRKLDVAVVSPDPHPFAKTLGPQLGDAIMAVHRQHGTRFHLGRQVTRIDPAAVHLDDGAILPADLVVVGIGVRPRTALAEKAGLAVDDGVLVDERLRTSDSDIFAVGDIARWPDPHSKERIRVEHWAVAQRQGQIAAANAVGLDIRYDAVPFFWTLHFDFSVRLVGHATDWDDVAVDGDVAHRGAELRFRKGGRDVAVATVERDAACLAAEIAMERRLGGLAAALPLPRE